MRKKFKAFFLSALALFLMLSCVFLRSPPLSVSADESDSAYSEKIVAVVYDNSGSMKTGGWSPYAKYALQGLISIFDSKDVMSIFPLNNVTEIPVELNESVKDRTTAINDVLNYGYNQTTQRTALTPYGSTPPTAVETAIKWLKGKGMNDLEPVPNTEYWLIVLSDGVFDKDVTVFGKKFGSTGLKTTGDLLETAIGDYIGLQTFYFGMGTSAGITNTPSLTAKEVKDKDDVINAMQEVSNRVTGRYTLQSGVNINGNKVTVDLSGCAFSVSSLAVLAQGEGNLTIDSVSCSTIQLKNKRACSISVDEGIKISGYSSIVVPVDPNGYLNKDVITLTFNSAPTSVSILVEPAIKLESSLQYQNGSEWEDVDVDTINTSFKKGAVVRTRYKLLDGKTGKNLTNVIGNVQASISYAGNSYGYEEGFKLKNGKNEVALSVNVTIGDSNYVLYNSWLCDIDENPDNFKVIADQKQNGDRVMVDYKVIYGGDEQTKEQINSLFKWELVELKDPMGNDIEPISKEVKSNGVISITYKTEFGLFGSYTNKIKVTYQENKRYRFGESELPFYPSSLNLTSTQSGGMTLTTKQVLDNTSSIEFNLSASGQPLSFSSSVIGYELKVDGVDKTKLAKIDGNVLKFVPNSDSLSSQTLKAGDRNVELKVWSTKDSNVNATASCKLTIIESTYVIEKTEENTKVDIYNLQNAKAKISFRINLDGEYLTAKELKDGLDSGEIKLTYNKFGWDLLLPPEVTTEVIEKGRDAYIVCSLSTSWWQPIASLSGSFIITGDKPLTLSVGGCTSVGTFTLSPVSILSRIWRWLVIILIVYTIIHIVLWLIGFFITKALPKGVLTVVKIQDSNERPISVSPNAVGFSKKEKFIWHLKRFIPFKEFINQPSEEIAGLVKFYIDDNNNQQMYIIQNTDEFGIPSSEDEDYEIFRSYRDDCSEYKGKGGLPGLRKKIMSGRFKNLLEDKDRSVPKETELDVSDGSYYVIKDKKGAIKKVVFFIE